MRATARLFLIGLLILIGDRPSVAGAEGYPSKPIRIVVPLSAGTGWDTRIRQIADLVSKSMKVPVIIENRPGAGTTIGAAVVAQSPPDGYTLLAATQADQSIAPAIYPSLPYDPGKQFAAVTQILAGTPILVINSEVPAGSFAELMALAKRAPGKYTAASYGYGTYTHILIAEFSRVAGVDVIHVPYKKASDALADVVTGRVSMMIDYYATCGPYISARSFDRSWSQATSAIVRFQVCPPPWSWECLASLVKPGAVL